jgi:hypothetical protein
VNWAGRREFAAIKVERFHPKHSGVEIRVWFQKFPKNTAMSFVTSRERDVRMPGSQIGLESDGQCRVLHSLMKLKKMGVTFADADPDDFRRALRWKCSDPLNRQEKSVELDRGQVCAQVMIHPFRCVGKETERKVHLIARGPAHTANTRIKIDK